MGLSLKPCPFCGGPPISSYVRDGRVIACRACHASSRPAYHGRADQSSAEERATDNWNQRAEATEAQAQRLGSLRQEIACAVDPEAWIDDLPVPTRAATIDFHARRQVSNEIATRVLSVVMVALLPADTKEGEG